MGSRDQSWTSQYNHTRLLGYTRSYAYCQFEASRVLDLPKRNAKATISAASGIGEIIEKHATEGVPDIEAQDYQMQLGSYSRYLCCNAPFHFQRT